MPVRPREADPALVQAAEALGVSFRTVKPGDFNNACTDMGDLTQLFPVVNFTFRGFEAGFTEKISGSQMKKRHIFFRQSLWRLPFTGF